MHENKLIQYRDLLYRACKSLSWFPICIELVGTTCYRVTLRDRILKARIKPKPSSTLLYKEALEIVQLPKIVAEIEYEGIPIRFMDWWEGYEFNRLRGNGIPPHYFAEYGEFLAKLNKAGIHVWDQMWNNVIYVPHLDTVIMCDDDAYVTVDRNYNERFLGTIATPEQREAFYEGYG